MAGIAPLKQSRGVCALCNKKGIVVLTAGATPVCKTYTACSKRIMKLLLEGKRALVIIIR